MCENASAEEKILQDSPRLGLDDRFTFRCGRDLDCFTRCCHDVSILLTPYDVLRMKRALQLDSSEFLERYTFVMQSRDSKVPVIFLQMKADSQTCPFVSEQGCGIYAHRPWACRMYPLGMAEPKDPQAAAQRFYFQVHEELCHGHGVGNGCSVRDWIDEQGIEPFDLNQASFRQLMSHPGWDNPEPLTPDKLAMFYMAAYDLDRFRRFVFDTRFLELIDVDEARIEALRCDDEELLEFAMDWLMFSLFQEKKRMKLTKSAKLGEAARTTAAEPANASL
jgi:Fe-S-cluster containining protein